MTRVARRRATGARRARSACPLTAIEVRAARRSGRLGAGVLAQRRSGRAGDRLLPARTLRRAIAARGARHAAAVVADEVRSARGPGGDVRARVRRTGLDRPALDDSGVGDPSVGVGGSVRARVVGLGGNVPARLVEGCAVGGGIGAAAAVPASGTLAEVPEQGGAPRAAGSHEEGRPHPRACASRHHSHSTQLRRDLLEIPERRESPSRAQRSLRATLPSFRAAQRSLRARHSSSREPLSLLSMRIPFLRQLQRSLPTPLP
jgi:hypothetical protein